MDEIICNECGKVFHPGNTNGLPNGVGFVLEDGTVFNVCAECLMKIGEETERFMKFGEEKAKEKGNDNNG